MSDQGHDPVTAIAEAEATGEVAEIFADIRATMEIPMLTSIWRTLVAIEDGLASGWRAAKPLYLTGQPAAALARIVERAPLPVPEALAPGQLACAGVAPSDVPAVRAIIDAYNRSNGMNMVALTALIAAPAGEAPNHPAAPLPAPWPTLRPLLAPTDIDPETWNLLHQVNRFGAGAGDGGLATLWRHLAHWPGLLALIHAGLAPMHRNGRLESALAEVHDLSQAEGARLARLRPEPVDLPAPARQMIADYVAKPDRVARMVTLGHGLARWLAAAPD